MQYPLTQKKRLKRYHVKRYQLLQVHLHHEKLTGSYMIHWFPNTCITITNLGKGMKLMTE